MTYETRADGGISAKELAELRQHLAAVEKLSVPVWVFDVDQARMLWANESAVRLWESPSLEELTQRDFQVGMSSAIKAMLTGWLEDAKEGVITEGWYTILPSGVSKRVFMRHQELTLAGGRVLLLSEGRRAAQDASLDQWVGNLPVAVAVFTDAGEFISANPVLGEIVSTQNPSLQSIVGADLAQDLLMTARSSGIAVREISLATARAERTFEIHCSCNGAANNNVAVEFRDIQEDSAQQQFFNSLNQIDLSTGALNRRGFKQVGQRRLDAGDASTLAVISIDNLDVIQETLGDESMDETLKSIAGRLRNSCPSQMVMGHLNDSSFGVLGESPSEHDELLKCVNELRDATRTPLLNNQSSIRPEVSVGVVQVGTEELQMSDLLARGEFAMRQARLDPAESVQIYSASMDKLRNRRDRVAALLQTASLEKEFHLEFQPIVDAKTLQISKAEALLRWNSPELGPVSPEEFIPLAEKTGLIVPMGEWVIEKSCEAAASLESELGHPVTVTINVSGLQSMQEGLAQKIREYISWVSIDPRQIEIELTESVLMTGVQSTRDLLQELDDFGVRIAIDDFGTGYSSLAYLHEFPFHSIKVDRSFIQRLPDKRSCTIVGAAVSIAESLGVSVTAEGVENEEQRTSVTGLGVSHLQGFMFARSMREADFVGWATRWETQTRFEAGKVSGF